MCVRVCVRGCVLARVYVCVSRVYVCVCISVSVSQSTLCKPDHHMHTMSAKTNRITPAAFTCCIFLFFNVNIVK